MKQKEKEYFESKKIFRKYSVSEKIEIKGCEIPRKSISVNDIDPNGWSTFIDCPSFISKSGWTTLISKSAIVEHKILMEVLVLNNTGVTFFIFYFLFFIFYFLFFIFYFLFFIFYFLKFFIFFNFKKCK